MVHSSLTWRVLNKPHSLEPKPPRVSPHVLSENERMNWLVKILLLLMAALLLTVVLFMSLLALALGMLRWLITGQKPQAAVIFSTYRQWQQKTSQHMRSSRPREDVIEAEVREVPSTRLEDKR